MRRTRHTRKRRPKHRRTSHKRKRGGMLTVLGGGRIGGYRLRGGKTPFAVSDYPPGFNKFTQKDKRHWAKIKRKKRKSKKHKSKKHKSKKHKRRRKH